MEAARQLIKFIHDEFGEHLSALLLGDYGSRQRRLSQIFSVTVSGSDREVKFNVEITTKDKWGLTCGQEPLVMLTLLKLLLSRHDLKTGKASYTYQEVLWLLGWRETKRSRDNIRDAIDINFVQSFNLWADIDEPQTPMDFRRRLHLLTAYDFFTEEDEGKGWGERGVYRGDFSIDFNLNFILGLRERSLLGIDWNTVTSIKRYPQVEGLSEETI